MASNTAQVIERAGEVAAATRDGAAWLDASGERLHLDTTTLSRTFRKFARRAQRLRAAAERPTCVAVFGASQAGKSYLVSSLATERGKPLMAVYGEHRLNFLRDLNPQGEKEATGLVSRFTIRSITAPRDAPVPLRLLSQTDVVKILANAFLEDFRLDEIRPPEQKEIADLFARLSANAAPTPQGGMTPDDLEELQEYFERHFRSHAMFQALMAAGYWASARDVIPRLPPRLRAEAYAPLWNNTAAFTKIVASLIGALERIGFPDTAYCGIDALMPRESGILNVDTVFALGEGGAAPVRVATSDGRAETMDRAVLAALVAEITVPMADKPWDFFDHTDLLDFPGARSREVIKDVDAFLSEPGKLGRVFLRGKVAYLFQRYNTEQEIAAMLLCVGPSNQDVQTLPEMVNSWIRDTIGPTPAARMQQRNSLFLVLTKFDTEFVEKMGGEDVASGQRWTTRLQASLLDFFGKAYDWPTHWSPDQPFNNCFWLRSTAIGFPALFDYQETGTEDGPRREIWAARADSYVAPRHAAYIANDSVRAHFADPERAWNEALKPNDGGIVYLAESLRPVCDPSLKAEQIAGRVEELARDVATQLRPFFYSGDIATELSRARQNARALLRALLATADIQMFGPLLRALMVSQDQMASVYWRLQLQPGDDMILIGRRGDKSETADELGLDLDDDNDTRAQDSFDQLAELAIEEWTRSVQDLAEDPATETVFSLPREQAVVMAGELARAARRLKLRQQIAESLRTRANFQQHNASAAQKPILVMEQEINRFVYTLGFDRQPPDKRPELANRSRRIFAPRPPVLGLPPLGPTQTPYDRTFHVDWMTAIGRTFEDNVNDAASGTLDLKANERLGALLRRLGQ